MYERPSSPGLHDLWNDRQGIHEEVSSPSIIITPIAVSPSRSSPDGSSSSSIASSIMKITSKNNTTTTSEDSSSTQPHQNPPQPTSKKLRKKSLGSSYQPGEYAVVCGRGKEYSLSTGNSFLRCLVNRCLAPYANASTKAEKSRIVTAIIQTVHNLPTGRFIRFEKSQWWEVDDAFARDKVGSLFRDSLFTKYRSSTKAKMEKKRIKNYCEAPDKIPNTQGEDGSLPSDLDDDHHNGINLAKPTTGSQFLHDVQEQGPSSVSLNDQSIVDPQSSRVFCDDDIGPTISLNTSGFSPKIHFQADSNHDGHFEPELCQSSSYRQLFPPPLHRQVRMMKVPRQVSDSSMTETTCTSSWKQVQSLSCEGQQYVEQFPLVPVKEDEWTGLEEQDTSLDTIMIPDIDELDSFLQSCF